MSFDHPAITSEGAFDHPSIGYETAPSIAFDRPSIGSHTSPTPPSGRRTRFRALSGRRALDRALALDRRAMSNNLQ